MFVWWGQVCALTIQTSVKFRNSSELPLSSLAKDVSLSNLTILLILRRSFQWCQRIFLTGICQKLKKPWKGLLATLTPFVRCAIDLTPDRSGSFSLRCQASLRPNPPPMGVVKRGGRGGGAKSSFLSWIKTQSFLHLTVEKVTPLQNVYACARLSISGHFFSHTFQSDHSLPLGFILCAACGSVVLHHAARVFLLFCSY